MEVLSDSLDKLDELAEQVVVVEFEQAGFEVMLVELEDHWQPQNFLM